jgi:Ala-tRNA(Pro) deacylase
MDPGLRYPPGDVPLESFRLPPCERQENPPDALGWRREDGMPIKRLKEFLDSSGVKYVVVSHAPAYTAQEIAASAHIPGRELAKTVMVKLDGKMAMAVLPANYIVDLDKLKHATGASKVALASESDFRNLFPECEVGAMPPFGNLYDIPVYAEKSLTEDEEIAFNAGSHKELFRMAYKDFETLVKPKTGEFGKLS